MQGGRVATGDDDEPPRASNRYAVVNDEVVAYVDVRNVREWLHDGEPSARAAAIDVWTVRHRRRLADSSAYLQCRTATVVAGRSEQIRRVASVYVNERVSPAENC